ncbi:hypothetical protein [Tardiphaga sp.]|uniref:hypothetical protein n=1 Tax=Tardiphaga sp. TaxID=1926292 RepID=UPI002619EDD5|nr:hypothetical protein [Tardiphaga sp.]MDB5619482.1 hypothetical protein [Tardiphaga sp.]
MTSRNVAVIGVVAALLASGGAWAQAYQPGEVFRLDLNHAVLSPRPIGPPAQFELVPVQAREEVKAEKPQPAARAARATKAPRVAVAKPRAVVRSKVAHKRNNPLDANAADTSVQVWPCRSGGICGWKK